MPSRDDFFNLYRHGFVRVAVATPRVRIGDPRYNGDATLELMQQAARDKAVLAVFPELGLSAYTCDDLFHQRTLIDATENALAQLLARTRKLPLAALVGLPVAVDGRLYNCAALVCRGRLVGVVPKTYLPNYREFYEARQFTPGDRRPRSAITLARQDVPFGSGLLFRPAEMPAFVLHVEICEDLWVPAPPSSFAALAGASVIGNLSASNIIIGKEGYRHQLVSTSRRAAWRPTCTARQALASPPLISPGTATRSSTRTGPCSPNRSASPPLRSSRSPTSISTGCWPIACGRTLSPKPPAAMPPRSSASAPWSSRCRFPGGACRSSVASAASPMCRAMRRAATCAAKRCTASRCRGLSRACGPRARGSSSSASPAGSTRPRRCSCARARSTS